ncbi:MAG: glycosyltransferase family 4 protein [Magnetococcales bacterium]|nr:glycosyltransferase family 4 protein [Magnetococcales bacterium]
MSDILYIHKGGRAERIPLMRQGRAPREFLYGQTAFADAGWWVDELPMPEIDVSPRHYLAERLFTRLTRLGFRPLSVAAARDRLAAARGVICFNDGFSLSLGYAFRAWEGRRPFLVGTFCGLSDFEAKAPFWARPLVRRLIRQGLAGLDRILFFGPEDQRLCESRYDLPEGRAEMLHFGVDESFWRPAPDGDDPAEAPRELFACGSDFSRDFATLIQAPTTLPVTLLTSLRVDIPPSQRQRVTLLASNFYQQALTDESLRQRYQRALAVVVPLLPVNQPSGQSVTLQAMACGKPVILSRIPGLWAPEILRDGENCLLIPPRDPEALARAAARLAEDPALARRLGFEARRTVERHFTVGRMERQLASVLSQAPGLEDLAAFRQEI